MPAPNGPVSVQPFQEFLRPVAAADDIVKDDDPAHLVRPHFLQAGMTQDSFYIRRIISAKFGEGAFGANRFRPGIIFGLAILVPRSRQGREKLGLVGSGSFTRGMPGGLCFGRSTAV